MAEQLFASLRGIQQRVANEQLFNGAVNRVESHCQALQSSLGTLTKLLTSPDVTLKASDGTTVPACQSVLIASSSVFTRMLSEETPLSESTTREVATDAPTDALRYVVAALHIGQQGLVTLPAPAAAIEALDLAARWELDDVVRSLAASLAKSTCSEEQIGALRAATRHLQATHGVPGRRAVWEELHEDVSRALAARLPDAATCPNFGALELASICAVLQHVGSSDVVLPPLEVDAAFPEGPVRSEGVPFSWLPGADSKARAIARAEGMYVGVADHSTVASARLCVARPIGDREKVRTTKVHYFENTSKGFTEFSQDRIGDYVADGKFHLRCTLRVDACQRKYEALNLWLMASGRAKSPLSPVDALVCLRACAVGFDVESATVPFLQEQLRQLQLDAVGLKAVLQTRLKDALYAKAAERGGASVAAACTALADVVAYNYARERKEGRVLELDAASFSEVLAKEQLHVKGEVKALADAVQWASLPGRDDDTISRVMPLVRFPFVGTLLSPDEGLRKLKQRSGVVTELLHEAIDIQMKPSATPRSLKRHLLLDGMDDSANLRRDKRRLLCKDDAIPCIDAARLLESSYTSA